MYKYQDIKAIHLEITSKCQAKCPMCPRRLNGGMMNPLVKLEEITLGQFKEWFPVDFLQQLNHINLCGNLGDPIAAKDTLYIIEYIRSKNPAITIQMNTNGSGRTSSWWTKLAQLDVFVIFGIDGLEDTHHLYRIDTVWNKIINNAKIFISAGGTARWDMLVFKHNEHQVDECRKLSEQIGFKSFTVKHTSRFKENKLDVLNNEGKTTHILEPTIKSKEMTVKVNLSQEERLPTITCKAKKDSQIYVSAVGNVSPCCWLDLEWYPHNFNSRIDYMNKIEYFPNLHNQTLEEIFNSNFFNKISSCWVTTGLKECSRQCGTFDKLNEQFVCR